MSGRGGSVPRPMGGDVYRSAYESGCKIRHAPDGRRWRGASVLSGARIGSGIPRLSRHHTVDGTSRRRSVWPASRGRCGAGAGTEARRELDPQPSAGGFRIGLELADTVHPDRPDEKAASLRGSFPQSASDVAGRPHRRFGLRSLPGITLAEALVQQPPGAIEPGDSLKRRRGHRLQPGGGPKSGGRGSSGTARRLGPRPPLPTFGPGCRCRSRANNPPAARRRCAGAPSRRLTRVL